MKVLTTSILAGALIALFAFTNIHSNKTTIRNATIVGNLKTYLIERDIPGAGKLTQAELKSISQTSCAVLKEMGPKIQWIESYVTGDKIYCVYKAENIEMVKEHAKKGGFPANNIMEISSIISPATAE